MAHFDVDSGIFRDGHGFAEPAQLHIGFVPVRLVRDGQVREQAHHAQQALVLVLECFADHRIPERTGAAVAAQTGVDLQMHPGWALLFPGCCHNVREFPTGNAEIDPGLDRGAEVSCRGVQPGQDRRLDAGRPQLQRFADVRHTDPGGSGLQRGRRHRHRAMAVPIGLDHCHDLRRRSDLGDPADVLPDRLEVDHGLAFRGEICAVHQTILSAQATGTAQASEWCAMVAVALRTASEGTSRTRSSRKA